MAPTYTPRAGTVAHRVLTAIDAAPEGHPWTVQELAAAIGWPVGHAQGHTPIRVALDTLKAHGIVEYQPGRWTRA